MNVYTVYVQGIPVIHIVDHEVDVVAHLLTALELDYEIN